MKSTWYKIDDELVSLKLYISANSKKTSIKRINERGLNIALNAKPIDGKANLELTTYLATLFDIKNSDVILKVGEHNKNKVIVVPVSDNIINIIQTISSEYINK